MNDRRTFLRGLSALPLIGGSVALIGQPSAVAEPVTADLLREYVAWLGFEHDRASYEMAGDQHREVMRCRWFDGPAFEFHHGERRYGAMDAFCHHSPLASSRAALVLSTVGCNWKETRS